VLSFFRVFVIVFPVERKEKAQGSDGALGFLFRSAGRGAWFPSQVPFDCGVLTA
jgi:hypothetical protein